MRALWVGVLAQEALQARWPASVIGVTSGGVFVISQTQRVIFLTYSPFRGPSTINIEPGLIDLRQNESGDKVFLSPNLIRLERSRIEIDVGGAPVWKADLPAENYGEQQAAAIEDRLVRAALLAYEQKGAQGLAPSLRWLVGKGGLELGGDLTQGILDSFLEIRTGIDEQDPAKITQAAERIAGHGRGLTPAADDCITGVVLSLNRWRQILRVEFDLDRLNEAILTMARRKTTSLSATIIQAATLGTADERIIRVLDGMITGDYDETQDLGDLVRMGHSSGVDALVGIALVLTSRAIN